MAVEIVPDGADVVRGKPGWIDRVEPTSRVHAGCIVAAGEASGLVIAGI
ncbi:MAG: hypothetical protein KGJ16_00330 [Betaproteobacteria bacterium]|nr:hypothetical protein [Betaproteobacteria bacterium]